MSCGVGRRLGSDAKLLWLWCRPVATAPIRLLPWEPPYAAGSGKGKKTKKKEELYLMSIALLGENANSLNFHETQNKQHMVQVFKHNTWFNQHIRKPLGEVFSK